MEKLWYLRFYVSPALLVLSFVVCNQIIIIIGFEWSVCQQVCSIREVDTQSSQGLRDQRKRGITWHSVCVRIHRQHSYLLQVRPKQRWIWLKSIRLLKHLLFLLLHHHHLAGLCPRKKIQRLKRLCRSFAIRVVIMEKLWYLRFCVSPALLVLSSVVYNQIIIIIGFKWSICQQVCSIRQTNFSRNFLFELLQVPNRKSFPPSKCKHS